MKKILVLLVSLLTFTAPAAQAEDLNIYADKQVEVHQKEQKLVAVGNAVASKDGNTVYADELSAFYHKTPDGKTAFKTMHGKGNVHITSPSAKAWGKTLDYDLTKEEIILKGSPAKIENTKGETITAEDKIIYYPQKQMAVALGNVTAHSKKNTVRADRMVSYFAKNAEGRLEMDEIKIFDNVKITTPQATAVSDKGTYYPQKGLVYLNENVTINQDGNILKGDTAETNLNTGVSRMLSSSGGKRVSGVFKEKEDDKKSAAQEKK